MSEVPSVGVGMVGYAFMGRAHSQAWQAVSRAFDPPEALAEDWDPYVAAAA